MYHVVSILDRVYETFPEAYPHTGQKTNFYRDVYPVFANAVNYGWVSPEAAGVAPDTKNRAHGPGQPGNLLLPQYVTLLADPSEKSKPIRQRIYSLMRHRSEEHTSEIQSLMRISYAVLCLKKKNKHI